MRVGGVIPAVLTPFSEEGTVLEESLREHISHLIEKGVGGLFVCGSAGQWPLMRIDERKKVAEISVEETRGRTPVIVHVGSTDTSLVTELAKHAEEAGADAVACITPHYYTLIDEKAIVEHYSLVSKATRLPLLVYNLPSVTRVNIGPELLEEIVSSCDGVAGIKDSTDDLGQIQGHVSRHQARMTILSGSDDLLFAALAVGVDGAVSGTANVVPDLMITIFEECKKGNLGSARRAQQRVNELSAILDAMTPLTPYHEAIALMGRSFGGTKRPLRPLTVGEKRLLEEALRLKGFLA